ncbi:MAG: SpoIIE family protein phosphatase [Flavobacteriales bacterium]|jgi:ligand-binding sensor domain-containing protein/serine phosphatase RsbU (regulator of sigma subunit)|nr:SpoIIE family protein phosphatase [Flavobacteriales bacterium]
MKKRLLFYILILIKFAGFSQEYKFNSYGQEQGLTDLFIYTIDQADNGYLMVGTSQGIGFYDGGHFEMKTTEDNLVDNQISASFKDSKGAIWYGHTQGGVSKYINEEFEVVHPGEGINSMINGIQEDSKGNIWFSTQQFGLFTINENRKTVFFNEKFEGRNITTLYIDENDYLFVGFDEKLEVYRFVDGKKGKVLSKIQNINDLEGQVNKIIPLENGRMIVATRSGLYAVDQKEKIFVVTPIKISNLEEELNIKDIYINSGRLWISTYGSGVLRTILTNNNCFVSEIYTNQNGLKGDDNIEITFIDREGVLWLGTAGDGLFSKEDNLFTFYFRDKVEENEIKYLDVTDTEVWVAQNDGLNCYDKQYGKLKYQFNSENSGLPQGNILCFNFVKDSIILVGFETLGLYYKFVDQEQFYKFDLSDDVLSRQVTAIAVGENYVWVGTQNGVFRVSIADREIKSFSMGDGLSHNSIQSLLVGQNNELYIGSKSAFLNIIEEDEVFKIPFRISEEEEFVSVSVSKIIESNSGNIWISTHGQGIFCFADTIIKHYDTRDGLFSNYCYGVAYDDKGKIWVSHDGGLSSIDLNADKVDVYNKRYGLNTRFSVSAIDFLANEVWFGTQNGVVRYNSKEALKNSMPPITSFSQVVINDDVMAGIIRDTMLPFNEHDLEFHYKGISLKNSLGLKYKCILEGYDDDWSEFTEDKVRKYTKVREGNYVFKVKSFNDDGVEGNMEMIAVSIAVPYYKKWWFYPALLLIIVSIVVFIVKYRERQHLNYMNTLSNELELRTAELVDQKEKMEEINKDLTDSINYAQRIQSAILPEDDFVKELFPNSFVLFKPRDIVSGDFYWIREYFGKKIVVFADCTGHGVPGGFMSMIGRILLRETCTVKNLRDPGVILEEIDKGLVNVLKQTDDIDSNKDGMDLGVCVIDSRTNMLSYAGAMRPLYVYRDGVRKVLKGNRHSVGGISQTKKIFDAQNFQLEAGDTLYMFSDGFPDQFGGSKGRKMKISVLNELLDQVCQMPFEQQKVEIDTFFETWKRGEPQMDDVLMIGLKV